MALPKKKSLQTQKKRTMRSAPVPDNAAAGVGDFHSLWRDELNALLDSKFNSLPEVVSAIADKVCVRVGAAGDTELRDFLVFMLDTDEEIRAELQSIFRLKR